MQRVENVLDTGQRDVDGVFRSLHCPLMVLGAAAPRPESDVVRCSQWWPLLDVVRIRCLPTREGPP